MTIGYLLMTVAILQFTVIPMLADFNRSHAANPSWPAHARFHVVTQVLTTSGLGVLALFFLWSERVEPALGVCVATMLGLTALGGFFASVATTRFYGGMVTNTVGTMKAPAHVDGNVINFSSALALLLLGRSLLV
jgi:hypothetical protein